MSTESIASSSPAQQTGTPCPSCGAPLAGDQRYCLECGERRVPMSSLLFGGSSAAGTGEGGGPTTPPSPPMPLPPPGGPQRNQTLTVIAGVGVLLIAIGVGVLIGRSGNTKQVTAPAQVITVAQSPGSTGAATAPTEATFTGDWPSGTNGFTVELQTLPQPGTSVTAVESAKTAASAKGAKEVGALSSEEFSSLTAGSYVIYSGVYSKRPEAEKALAGLRKNFSGAKVIKVSSATSSAGGASKTPSSAGAGASGAGSSPTHPAPPQALHTLEKAKGKNYEEKSKSLPNVVETG